MSSLDTLKQELITQKQVLESKGFTVTTQHQYPAPSEITSTIQNIDANMSKLSNLALSFITGADNNEIYIPTDPSYTQIRDYAYYSSNLNAFYCNNTLVIPSNINRIGIYAFSLCTGITKDLIIPPSVTEIGRYAFYGCSNITGNITIPEDCEVIGQYPFAGCAKITSADIYSSLENSATYFFANCTALKRITFHPPATKVLGYFAYSCTALEEMNLCNTINTISAHCVRNATNLKRFTIESTTPPTITATSFNTLPTSAHLIVPYNNLYAYATATNYVVYASQIIGFGDFEEGDLLPATTENFNLTWYANLEDLENEQNAITACPITGRLYASKTEIVNE